MQKLKLTFFDYELFQSNFSAAPHPPALLSIRGKTAGAIRGAGSFQWTTAVQAFCCLALLTKYYSVTGANNSARLIGRRGSLAISLDYALSKQVQWLQDMFGVDINGQLIARRIFLRTNSNLKLPGPLIIALNESYLAGQNISIEIDGKSGGTAKEILELAQKIASDCKEEISVNQEDSSFNYNVPFAKVA